MHLLQEIHEETKEQSSFVSMIVTSSLYIYSLKITFVIPTAVMEKVANIMMQYWLSTI